MKERIMEQYTYSERQAILTYLENEKRRIENILFDQSCQGMKAHCFEFHLEIVRNHINTLLNR